MDAKTQSLYAKQLSTICRGGSGTGGAATCVLAANGGLRSATIKAAGTGYLPGNVLTVATGSGGTFTVDTVNAGVVTGITKLASGTGYNSVDGAVTTCSAGSNCTLDTTAAAGELVSAVVSAGGTGYVVGNILTVAGGTGGKFTVLTVNSETGAVLTVGAPVVAGSGYTSANGVATTCASGTGCTLVTVAEKLLGTITVGNGGENYVTAIARFSGGSPSSGSWHDGASVTVANGVITGITAPAGSIKYATAPTITIIPGGPADAADLNTAMKAYDTSLQNARVKEILDDAMKTELLTVEQAPIVAAAIAAL